MTSPWAHEFDDIPEEADETPGVDYAVFVHPLDYDRVLAHLKKRTIASANKCCGEPDCGFRVQGEKLEQALRPSEEVSQGFVRIHTSMDGTFSEATIAHTFESLDNPALFDAEVVEYMRTMVHIATFGY